MPFVQNQGAKIYWDEQGSGEPLLLIMGLSYPSYMWHRSRPVFANSYRTIALDNRGAETPRQIRDIGVCRRLKNASLTRKDFGWPPPDLEWYNICYHSNDG